MSGLATFLDWLDETAGGLIRLAYLAAGVTAVAVYFGAGQLPAYVDRPLNAALPWALAFALETHTYLTARRVRAAWQDRAWGALKVHLGVLAVLLAFSAWNQLGYLNGVWTPPTSGALALPLWLAYTVRALIVPLAFMAAAFLAPLAPAITAQIEGEARATLADVFKIARRQRKALLRQAETSGRDLTGALVELVSDGETRRIIGHAYKAIGAGGEPAPDALPAAQDGAGVASPGQPAIDAAPAIGAAGGHPTASQDEQEMAPAGQADTSPIAPDDPPPGGGVRTGKSRRDGGPAILRLTPLAPSTADPRPAARRGGLGRGTNGRSSRQVRTPLKTTASREADARRAWAGGARTVGAMIAATGMSRNAAGGWTRALKAEAEQSARMAQ